MKKFLFAALLSFLPSLVAADQIYCTAARNVPCYAVGTTNTQTLTNKTMNSGYGTASAPPFSVGQTNTGIWSGLNGHLDFTVQGVNSLTVSGSSSTVNHAGIAASTTGNSVQITTSGTDAAPSLSFIPQGGGNLGFNIAAPVAQFEFGGNKSASAWTTGAIGFKMDAATYTDTTSSGTASGANIHSISTPTLAASNATTFTNAYTWVIGGCPTAGTNVTITNCYALYLGGDSVQFGNDFVNGYVSVSGTGIPTAGINKTSGGYLGLIAGGTEGTFIDTSANLFVGRSNKSAYGAGYNNGNNFAKITSTSTGAFSAGFGAEQWSNNTTGAFYECSKTRGTTIGTPAAAANGDTICTYDNEAYDGAAWRSAAKIVSSITGAVSSGVVPGQYDIYTTNTSGVSTKAATIDNAQIVNFANAIKVGGTTVPSTPGTGLSASGATLNSTAVDHISYQPGLITTIVNTKSGFYKYGKTATVDNIEGSASVFTTCTVNPTITIYECGTDASCATSPTTIGTATITGAGQAFDGTVNSSAITAGDFIAFAITAGSCASVDLGVTMQVHSN